MDKIRIGNDIHIVWSIFRDNQPEVFEGKDVEVRLIHTRTRDVMPLDWVISEGVVSATFYGKDQINTGDYKLMLVENNGAPNMATIDECKAFTLVQCSCQERKEEPSTSLQLHKVQLTSYFALSGGGNISVEGYPNVDELEEVKELSGNENIIITDSEGNKKTTIGNLKEYVEKGGGGATSSEYFKSYPTMADYEADKANIEIPCVVMIEDTEEIVWHSTKGNYNAYYEVNQHYYDSMEQLMGASPEMLFPSIIGGLDGIPLTFASILFSSFIVNGEEKITGDEYVDLEAGGTGMFKHCSICVPFDLDETYEVSYTLKSQEELAEYGELIASLSEFTFALTPLTKIIIDESWRNDYLEQMMTYPIPFILFAYAKAGAFVLREVTVNLKEYPLPEYGPSAGMELSIILFRQFLKNSSMGSISMLLAEGDRVVKVPNGDEWGYPYEEGMSEDEFMQGGFIAGLTIPANIDDYLPPFNVERFDYGTI